MGQHTLDIMRFKLNQPALIEASAGTGKTYTITNLVLRILLGSGDQQNSLERPLPIEDLLVVTFTNTATADLRRRIYERIRDAHVLFENFMDVAQQEIKKKAADLVDKEIRAAKRAAGDDEHHSILDDLDQSLPKEELIEQFCQRFLNNESIAPNLNKKLAEFKLNVETIAREKLGCSDDFLIQLLKQIADKDLVKQAISVLIRAERNIDNAAICTIHSFCNRTLTQIYAFEANEAFASELSADLSEQEKEATIHTWRKLFYKLNASPAVLRLLQLKAEGFTQIHQPFEISSMKNEFSSVRLSQETDGVFGYQLKNFKLPGFKDTINIAKDYSLYDIVQCMFVWIDILDYALVGFYLQVFDSWQQLHLKDIPPYIDLEARDCGPLISNATKTSTTRNCLNKDAKPFVNGLASFVHAHQQISADASLQSKMQQTLACIKKLSESDHPLDLTELKAGYDELLKIGLKESLGQETVKLLESAVDDIVASNFWKKGGAKLIDARRKPAKTPDYLAFTQTLSEFAQDIHHAVDRKVQFRAPLTALLYMLINQQIQEICVDHHLMSNDDLLLRLDKALQRPGFGDRLARLIRMRYPLAMIDEFQDTDPIQYSIFSKIYLNKEALKDKAYCYLIGDPKQSIYAFRGSDINSYLKARKAIEDITDGGLHTLNVNYRSTEDVIGASNALFSRVINADNVSPFKEKDIPFTPVGAHKMLNAEPKLPADESIDLRNYPADSIEIAQAWGAPFVIEHMTDQGLLFGDSEVDLALGGPTAIDTASKTEPPRSLANNYVVKFDNNKIINADEKVVDKGKQDDYYSCSLAFLVKKVLQDGKIYEKDGYRAVKPSDIAILVRSSSESDKVISKLQDLGISSVYFSDRSSVLFSGDNPTQESLDLLYLMEAMSDPANRSKVMRILGSGLLKLNADEFLEHSNGLCFEKEVACLNQCGQVWAKYGFMPAFMLWCDAPEHQVTSRLLSVINGERSLTNYIQLAELIQGAHNHHSGIQPQIRWFYDTLFSGQNKFDSEATQKRLESEHEQIKIMTIHKSKGLEFPIVFMPFLWRSLSSSSSFQPIIPVSKYYDNDLKHRVLDFDNSQVYPVLDVVEIERNKQAHKDDPESKEHQENPIKYCHPSEIESKEDDKERMRLLYVAITRARYANFFFISNVEKTKSSDKASSLMELLGVQPTDKDLSKVFDPMAEHPELFTFINGVRCSKLFQEAFEQRYAEAPQLQLSSNTPENKQRAEKLQAKIDELLVQAIQRGFELYQNSKQRSASKKPADRYVFVGNTPLDAKLYNQIKALRQEIELLQVNNVPILPEDGSDLEPCAMSFAYDGAVDFSFNIMSYSSLTSAVDPFKQRQLGNRLVSKRNDDEDGAIDVAGINEGDQLGEDANRSKVQQQLSNILGKVSSSGLGSLVGGDQYVDYYESATSLVDEMKGALANKDLLSKYSVNEFFQAKWDIGMYYDRGSWGKRPTGLNFSFMGGAKAGTFLHELLRLIPFEQIQQKTSSKHNIFCVKLRDLILRRADLAPVYNQTKLDEQFLAMSDWLQNIVEAPLLKGRFQNLALSDLEPNSYQCEMNFHMTTKRFETAAIDKLCQELAKDLLPPDMHYIIPDLQLTDNELFGFIVGSIDLACRFNLNHKGDLKYRPDLSVMMGLGMQSEIDRLREQNQEASVEPDYKYYVIDYKSNILGNSFESYSTSNMLQAIYSHRYDVQFLFYTLALYRFLKRRMGVDFNAEKEFLKDFYEQHVGGVMYLFLRGMQGDYLRRNITPGVFSFKIDFNLVYQLDQLFGGEMGW